MYNISTNIEALQKCNVPFFLPLYHSNNIANVNRKNSPFNLHKLQDPNFLKKSLEHCCLSSEFLEHSMNSYYKPYYNILRDVSTMLKSVPTGRSIPDVLRYSQIIKNINDHIENKSKDDLDYIKFHSKHLKKELASLDDKLEDLVKD